MQNAGLATGLALTMGKITTAGLAPAVFGPVMNVNGSCLASWWHNHLPKENVSGTKDPRGAKQVANADIIS
jgi:BASS family bile acid:Na+ symporter